MESAIRQEFSKAWDLPRAGEDLVERSPADQTARYRPSTGEALNEGKINNGNNRWRYRPRTKMHFK